MAKYFRGQPPARVSGRPNASLIDFLQKILTGLEVQETVGERFTQEQLADLGAEFRLNDHDWGQLYFMIPRLKE